MHLMPDKLSYKQYFIITAHSFNGVLLFAYKSYKLGIFEGLWHRGCYHTTT